MSNAPESVPFVRRVLQTLAPAASAGVSQTDERWLLLARHATVVDRYSYSSPFTWVRQVIGDMLLLFSNTNVIGYV
jgi:hypothetical protein